MDKLNPTFQDTPVTTKSAESVSQWYKTEVTSGEFTAAEVGYYHAAGWTTTNYARVGSGPGLYSLQRRVLEPEKVLRALVKSYTTAYNDGRQLNDQRYDDILVLFTQILDKTEDSFNTLEAADDVYEDLVETLVSAISTDHATYAADVDGDLDEWGTSLLEEINARFDAELGKAQQALVDRGMYSGSMWTTISAGVERERTRSLNEANDRIEQRQLELKHKVQAEKVSVQQRVLAARDRLRVYLREAKDRQVAVRNQVAEALGRLVEARTDSYPDMAAIGRLAGQLGAGSPESFTP